MQPKKAISLALQIAPSSLPVAYLRADDPQIHPCRAVDSGDSGNFRGNPRRAMRAKMNGVNLGDHYEHRRLYDQDGGGGGTPEAQSFSLN